MIMTDLVTVCNKVDLGSSVILPVKFCLYCKPGLTLSVLTLFSYLVNSMMTMMYDVIFS